MKERALEIARSTEDLGRRLNVLREYIQASVLRSLHESQAFQSLSFVGGTALRFLHGLQRFSEDLDFSLEASEGYDPTIWLSKLKRDLDFAGFDSVVGWNDRKTVHTGWVRIASILNEAGLSPLEGQKLSIKIEIDTQPPLGAHTENRIINRHFLVAFRHHDLASLMAGKVHALIARRYEKGRDWYDLVWYCSRSPRTEPNETLLQSALDQTQDVQKFDASKWRETILETLDELDVRKIRNDVYPFLEQPSEVELLSATNLRNLLEY